MSSKGRCTVTSMYLPGDGYTLEKISLADVTLWALHPVSAHLGRITSWKDLKDLSRAADRAKVIWDHSVLVCPATTHYTKDEMASYLADGARITDPNLRRVYLDEDTARGRRSIPLLGGAADTTAEYQNRGFSRAAQERATLIKWLASTDDDAGQRELRDLGAPQIAHLLFGDATRRDLIAALGTALLKRGPTGKMGSRHDVVALAVAAAEHLSPDRLVDILAWPVALPTNTWTPEAISGLGQVLGPLNDLDRHRLLEALAIEHGTFARLGRRNQRNRDDDYDVNDYDDDDDYYDYNRRYGRDIYASMKEQLRKSVINALEPYSPEIGDWLNVSGNANAIITPGPARRRIALAGALTSALIETDIALPTEVRSFDDRLSALMDAAVPESYGWEWPSYWASLSGKTVEYLGEGAQICLPKSPRDLRSWGEAMGNCIGGYDNGVEDGRTLIAGVRDASGTLIANMSMNYNSTASYPGWHVDEIKGRFNADLPNDAYIHLSNILSDHVEKVKSRAQINAAPLQNAGIVASINQRMQGDYDPDRDLSVDEDLALQDFALQDIELRPGRPGRGFGRRPVRPRAARIRTDTTARHQDLGDLAATISSQESVDLVATKEALALVAPLQEISLRDIVELIACYEPTAAYFDNVKAGAVRDALARAGGGDLAALDTLTGPGSFVAGPATSAAVISVLRSWFSGSLSGRTPAPAMV